MDTKGLICTVDYAKWVLEQRILERESCRTVEHAQLHLLFPVVLTVVPPLTRCDLSMVKVAAAPVALSFSKTGITCASYLQHWLLRPCESHMGATNGIEQAGNSRRTSLIFCVQRCGNYRREPRSFTWLLRIAPFDYTSHFLCLSESGLCQMYFPCHDSMIYVC